jgi:hypothetical protein
MDHGDRGAPRPISLYRALGRSKATILGLGLVTPLRVRPALRKVWFLGRKPSGLRQWVPSPDGHPPGPIGGLSTGPGLPTFSPSLCSSLQVFPRETTRTAPLFLPSHFLHSS